mmetsp:Transcript_38489/g.88849  ORF Transcript_38489/g.88849 Transcript_38489/m.88849 type:complete len:266 (-) Transcript_38489:1825-2622(-)
MSWLEFNSNCVRILLAFHQYTIQVQVHPRLCLVISNHDTVILVGFEAVRKDLLCGLRTFESELESVVLEEQVHTTMCPLVVIADDSRTGQVRRQGIKADVQLVSAVLSMVCLASIDTSEAHCMLHGALCQDRENSLVGFPRLDTSYFVRAGLDVQVCDRSCKLSVKVALAIRVPTTNMARMELRCDGRLVGLGLLQVAANKKLHLCGGFVISDLDVIFLVLKECIGEQLMLWCCTLQAELQLVLLELQVHAPVKPLCIVAYSLPC